jgi:hypothetical protein
MKIYALLFSLAALPSEAKTIPLANAGGALPEVSRIESVRGAAKSVAVQFRLRELSLEPSGTFIAVHTGPLPLTSDLGLPALPFQAVTVDAALSDVRVAAELGEAVSVSAGAILPAQTPACRCVTPFARAAFVDHSAAFQAAPSGFRVESLGDYRGQAVSRVLLYPHKYDPKTGTLLVYPNARFTISFEAASPRAKKTAPLYDYLVITPRDLAPALAPWLDWKRASQNLSFTRSWWEVNPRSRKRLWKPAPIRARRVICLTLRWAVPPT